MNFKDFIVKLQGLEEKQKKIIIWIIVGILATIMGFFWIKSVIYRIEYMGEVNLNLPELENNLETFQNGFNDIESEKVKDEIADDSIIEAESKEEIESQIKKLQEKLDQIEENNQ